MGPARDSGASAGGGAPGAAAMAATAEAAAAAAEAAEAVAALERRTAELDAEREAGLRLQRRAASWGFCQCMLAELPISPRCWKLSAYSACTRTRLTRFSSAASGEVCMQCRGLYTLIGRRMWDLEAQG